VSTTATYVGEVSVDDGTGQTAAFIEFQVQISKADLDAAAAEYNPSSTTSPVVAHCRPPFRAILDSYLSSLE
jgi:hypothetical protein